MKHLYNVSHLNSLFDIKGNDWIEMDDADYEPCGVSPTNDLGGEDCFWNRATPEIIEQRNLKIKQTYQNLSPEGWVQLNQHRVKGNPQRHPTVFEGQEFISQNAAARHIMKAYGVSRNTAIRYLKEGRHPTNPRQPGRQYGGHYMGSKYV